MKKLTVNEEIYLIAIWHLKDEAFGLNIRKKIQDLTGNSITFGTLYNTLDYMVRKGYIQGRRGGPSFQRGGHNKIFYSITPRGEIALQQARELHKKIWEDVPPYAFNKK